jgi:hypothetical protein
LHNGLDANWLLHKSLSLFVSNIDEFNRKQDLINMALDSGAQFADIHQHLRDFDSIRSLFVRGLPADDCLKSILSGYSIGYVDSINNQWHYNAPKEIFVKEILHYVSAGADLNLFIIDKYIYYSDKLLEFILDNKELVFERSEHPLSRESYLKFAKSMTWGSNIELAKKAIDDALGIQLVLDYKLLKSLNLDFTKFKEILIEHFNPTDLLSYLFYTKYSIESSAFEQHIFDLIMLGANLNELLDSFYSHEFKTLCQFIEANNDIVFKKSANSLNPDKFLKKILAGYWNEDQEDFLVKMLIIAIEQGADLNTISGEHLEISRSVKIIDALKEHIIDKFGASILLYQASISSINSNDENYNIKYSLIKYALERGANVNLNFSGATVLEIMGYDDKVVELLKSYGAKAADTQLQELYQNDLHHLLLKPSLVFEMKYKNLNAQESVEAKMPYTLHHIWLTHPDNPKEIRPQDIQNAIHSHEVFANSDVKWTQVVWSNDPTLIPNSVQVLAEYGIEVRSLYDYKEEFSLFDLVESLIEKKKWGMASDILRYDLIGNMGGVYADINYIFLRDVTHEALTYNYFTNTYGSYYLDNFFFGASKGHPILHETIQLVARNMFNPPKYLSDIYNQDSRVITDMGTANPTFVAYYKMANRDGNIDVAYPKAKIANHILNYEQTLKGEESVDDQLVRSAEIELFFERFREDDFANSYQCQHDELLCKFVSYLYMNEICGSDEFLIGYDSSDGGTWTVA